MSKERATLCEVAWDEAFPALRLLAALRMALNFRALALAAIALAGTAAGWRVCGALFENPDDAWLSAQIAAFDMWPWERPVGHAPVGSLVEAESWTRQSPLLVGWKEISGPFVHLFSARTLTHFTYLLVCGLWSLVVWSFFGGAISRQAAVAFARHENVSWKNLTGFVRPRLPSYFIAPLFPILGVFLIAVFLAVVGLVMRAAPGSGFGVLIASLAWPLVLVGAFAMAFLMIGLFFGWPLMWGAISAEGTDSFGALSHAYSYSYQRPLLYLIYAAIAAAAGVLGWYVVVWFLEWIGIMASWGVSWGSGWERLGDVYAEREPGSLGKAGLAIIRFWEHCLTTLAFGFIFSYFWCASTAIYFLLRRQVDATELDEVFMQEEQELRGLPPLKTGADGVAEMNDAANGSDRPSGGESPA